MPFVEKNLKGKRNPGLGWRSGQQGRSLVETALLLPMFLVIILGVLETGRYWWARQALTSAIREGGRQLSSDADVCPPVNTTAAVRHIQNILVLGGIDTSPANTQIQISSDLSGYGPGGVANPRVKLKITYQFDSLLPVLPSILSGSPMGSTRVQMSQETTFSCEPSSDLSGIFSGAFGNKDQVIIL